MRHATGMVARILLILSALCLSAPALADDREATLDGHWALVIDDATIFVFALEQSEDGGWAGAWTRPSEIDSNGVVFRQMSGQQTVRPISTQQRQDMVQLTFAGPEGARRNDVLQFRFVSPNQAQLNYVGIAGEPYPLVRVNPDTPLGPFDELRIYDRDNAVTEAEFVAQAEVPTMPEDEDLSEGPGAATRDEGEAEESPRISADFLDDI